MAITKIKPVKWRVDNLIRYAVNPEKTAVENYEEIAALHEIDNVIEYTKDDMKTEKQLYVTGVNCNEGTATAQFMQTKKCYGKTDGNLAYHVIQSFAEDEVDAETAHRIGCELAENLWGDRFEVLVATHQNVHCLHNHIVINSVSFTDGKKYNDCKRTYNIIREESDRLCRENDLSVIRRPQKGLSKPYAEWKAEKEGQYTVRGCIRHAIDVAADASLNKTEFLDILRQMGYELDLKSKHQKIRHSSQPRFVRFDSLGPGYSADEILGRIYDKMDRYYPEEWDRENDDPKKSFPEGWEPGNIDNLDMPQVYEMYRELMDISYHRTIYNRWLNSFVGGDLPYYENHIQNLQVLLKYNIKTDVDMERVTTELLEKLKETEALKRNAINGIKRGKYHDDRDLIRKSVDERDYYSMYIKFFRDDLHYLSRVAEQYPELKRKLKLIEQHVYPEYYKAKAMADAKEAARYASGYYSRGTR